jgi:hypothetical protein
LILYVHLTGNIELFFSKATKAQKNSYPGRSTIPLDGRFPFFRGFYYKISVLSLTARKGNSNVYNLDEKHFGGFSTGNQPRKRPGILFPGASATKKM